MAIKNNLTRQVDLPAWEWMRPAANATTALSATCSADDGIGRYIYYVISTLFFRYDTWADSWQQLASPPIAAVTFAELRYTEYGGYRGNCLGSTHNTITLPGLELGALVGYKIRIIGGTGVGQERTVLSTTDNVLLDNGVVTGASALVLTDTAKKWKINQFVGCQVRIVYGTGVSQVRRVLYNDATNLYVSDPNFQQLDPWNNTPFSATAPYAIPASTPGAQSFYYIEQITATIDSDWEVLPDSSSSFVILSGAVWFISAVATAPWMSFQCYDVLSDTWNSKTAMGGQLIAALGVDATIERTGEVGGVFASGLVTVLGTSSRAMGDSTQSWPVDRYCKYQVRITSGTGIGQRRTILGNISNILFVDTPWSVVPDATSKYSIYGNTDRIYMVGGGLAAMFGYSVENDTWFTGAPYDFGMARNISCAFPGQESFGVITGALAASGVQTVVTLPTFGGTGYVVGDILTLSTGGANARVRVTGVVQGVVTAVELYTAGSGYSVSAGQATTGGTGTGCTIEVAAVNSIGRINTALNHNLVTGDTIVFNGCTEDAWNATYVVLCTDSLNFFDVVTTAVGSMTATTSQGALVLVDAAKSWIPGEHVGKLVNINIAGTAPTTQIRRISANTSNTLTIASITAAVNGTSRYSIQESWAAGRDEQFKIPERGNTGWATGGSNTSLVDSTKKWVDRCWVGYSLRIVLGTGAGSEIAITGSTDNTLSFASQSFVPDATSKYIIMDSFGLMTNVTNVTNATITDSTKNWTVNQWAGRRLRVTSGTGAGAEIAITSNTNNIITCTGVFATAPDTTSTYQIYGVPAKGAGIELMWIFGNVSAIDDKGKYLLCARGGASNVFDKYNISTGVWENTLCITPQSLTLTTGSMYTYDTKNTVYFQKDATGSIYALDVNNHFVRPAGQVAFGMSTAIIGNRMEFIVTSDGLQYIYIMAHGYGALLRMLMSW